MAPVLWKRRVGRLRSSVGHRLILGLTVALLLFVAGTQLYMISDGSLGLADAWFALLLACTGAAIVLFRPERDAVVVLSLLLASLSVLSSSVVAEELLVLAGPTGQFAGMVWTALLWLFPFIFVHFSLVFPVTSRWVQRHQAGLYLLYLPYVGGLTTELLRPGGGLLMVLTIPIGLVIGLSAFVYQYVRSLTAAERNRLRIIIVGCLLGALPFLFSTLAGENQAPLVRQTASLLLPVFPAALVFAVLRENFSELGGPLQRWILGLLVTAGAAAATVVAAVLLSLVMEPLPGPSLLLLFLPAAVLTYLAGRRLSSTVGATFGFSAALDAARTSFHGEFQPIRPNPFIVGNPVRTPDMFFGRQEDFRFIRHTLNNRSTLVVVTGERRTGKTSILYQILQGQLGDEYAPAFIDMQGVVSEDDHEFLDTLAGVVADAAPGGKSGSVDALNRERPFSGFRDRLATVLRSLPGRKLLLLVDEYELIEKRAATGRLSPELPDFLNSLLETFPSLGLVLTGSRPLEAKPFWAPLLSKSVYREISFLQRADAEELLRRPLQGRAVYRPSTLAEIVRLSNGHPFYTQLLGQIIVDVLNDQRKFQVDRLVLREVILRIVENPPPHLLYQWSALSQDEKLVLCATASQLQSGREYASDQQIADTLDRLLEGARHLSPAGDVRFTLESLRSRRVLDRDQTRYRFTMDLFRRWVSQEVTVWTVLQKKRKP